MFIPGHHSPSRDFARDYVSNAHLFARSTTLTRENSPHYGATNVNSSKAAELSGINPSGAVSPSQTGGNCNARPNAHEERASCLHGDTRGCAVLDDPAMGRWDPGGDSRRDSGCLPAAAADADPGSAARNQSEALTHPGYTNHPTYGFVPSSNRYLALLAGRVAL